MRSQQHCTGGGFARRPAAPPALRDGRLLSRQRRRHREPGGHGHHERDDHSYETLGWIASPGDFYNQATAGPLDSIFAAIATDIGQGSSRLVDDSY